MNKAGFKAPRQRKRKRCEEKIAVSQTLVELPCEIELQPEGKKHRPSYDACNTLALPSKKVKVQPARRKGAEQGRPFLSKKRRRELERLVAKKEKKKKRSALLDELSSVQAPQDINFASIVNHKKIKENTFKKEKVIKPQYDEEDEDTAEDDAPTVLVDIIKSVAPAPVVLNPKFTPKLNDLQPKEQKVTPDVIKQRTVPSEKGRPTVFVSVNRSASVQEARMKLPILAEEQVIMETINENPIVVLAGETGSGKTTQVPQFLYEAGYARNGKMICVTEPRRVAAISMSSRVASEMNLSGREVSYLIRFEGNATPSTRILFMTDGVLLREARRDLLLSKYSVVVVDEAHERSVFTDILVGLLSRVVRLRQQRGDPLKLIVMSATLRLEDFTENTRLFRTVPPVIKVDSRQFPVTVHFARKTVDDYVSEAYRKTCKIHTQLPDGGILVFLTGQKEVKFLVHKLRSAFPLNQNVDKKDEEKINEEEKEPMEEQKEEDQLEAEFDSSLRKKGGKKKKKKKGMGLNVVSLDSFAETVPEDELADELEGDDDLEIADCELPAIRQPLWVLPLYSLLPSHKQALVFRPPPTGARLCVVATNIAETSLTIPGVKYVVDTGRTKHRRTDKLTGVSTFEVDWTSKASAEQRTGRAGRVAPGHCYRLYSSAVFNDKFPQFSIPDILNRPVDDLFLQMKAMGIDKVINFPFPSPPSMEQLKAAEVKLTLLGALEPPSKEGKTSGGLTELGKAISRFPVTPRFGKVLTLCLQHQGLIPHAVNLVATLSVEQLLLDPGKAVKECALSGQAKELGDPAIVLWLLYAASKAAIQGEDALSQFCEKHSLRLKGVREVSKLRAQLTSEINMAHPELNLSMDPLLQPPSDAQCRLLRQVLLAGSVDQVALRVEESDLKDGKSKWKRAYKTELLEEPVLMPANCSLAKVKPQWVIFQELFETTNVLMRGVTSIEPEWLPVFAPSLCSLSAPLADPPPKYDTRNQKIMCWVTGTYGKVGWELPRMEMEIPKGHERYKYLAYFILEGEVFPTLAEFKHTLILNTNTLIKSATSLAPKNANFVNQLIVKEADSAEKIRVVWKEDPKYLLQAFKQWIPESAHLRLESLWPPK
ncbi:probable ATP-dependent RNA helicase kurz [Neocloeon triangulifer]|uniref:probable ATP-dependent RNA helicase kurz n=1 Tax=Neocloeon triangulifer TaxID=2078957 RepID=UPI00286F4506|nr:probable ATP-dependent RNA helicase kurz [Neocloeon triangulifer]